MEGCYRLAAATPHLKLGQPRQNVSELVHLAREASSQKVAALVFPELAVTGYTCADLFYREDLQRAALAAVLNFASLTAELETIFILGLPLREGAALFNAAAIIYRGKVIDYVRKRVLPNYAEYYEKRQFATAPKDEKVKVFDCGAFRFGVEICEDGWCALPPSSVMALEGVDAVFNLSASTDFLGKANARREMVRERSARLGTAYVMACAGVDESCSDAVFGGASIIAAGGKILGELPRFQNECQLVSKPIDLGALRYRRLGDSSNGDTRCAVEKAEVISFASNVPQCELEKVSQTPFLDAYGEANWVETLLEIQAVALARRMKSAHANKLVVGVSGGADSALALMGARAALARLDQSAADLIALVMPAMGSSEHTQKAAVRLAQAVGATVRVIDICEACHQHLKDIGHDENVHDIAYENVQARERTQVLMDVANMEGALVVGTGDLSEIALGWNTYNGDHMSMYQLNASIPKTMVLAALKELAEKSAAELRDVLRLIASSPITPELVPGAQANDTEARLGPYLLHDFFLYHFIAEGASAAKLLDLARLAFKGTFSNEEIERTRDTFLRRFFASQYKRNCVPDGPKITLSLSPRADWRMPSDFAASSFPPWHLSLA